MVIAYTCMSLESKLHGQLGFLAIQMKRDVSLESDQLTSHALLCIYYRTRIYRRLLKLESTLNGLLRLTFVVYEYLKFPHDSDHAKCGGVLFRLRLLYFSYCPVCLGPNGQNNKPRITPQIEVQKF